MHSNHTFGTWFSPPLRFALSFAYLYFHVFHFTNWRQNRLEKCFHKQFRRFMVIKQNQNRKCEICHSKYKSEWLQSSQIRSCLIYILLMMIYLLCVHHCSLSGVPAVLALTFLPPFFFFFLGTFGFHGYCWHTWSCCSAGMGGKGGTNETRQQHTKQWHFRQTIDTG